MGWEESYEKRICDVCAPAAGSQRRERTPVYKRPHPRAAQIRHEVGASNPVAPSGQAPRRRCALDPFRDRLSSLRALGDENSRGTAALRARTTLAGSFRRHETTLTTKLSRVYCEEAFTTETRSSQSSEYF